MRAAFLHLQLGAGISNMPFAFLVSGVLLGPQQVPTGCSAKFLYSCSIIYLEGTLNYIADYLGLHICAASPSSYPYLLS